MRLSRDPRHQSSKDVNNLPAKPFKLGDYVTWSGAGKIVGNYNIPKKRSVRVRGMYYTRNGWIMCLGAYPGDPYRPVAAWRLKLAPPMKCHDRSTENA